MTPKEKVTARIKRDHRILISLRIHEENTAKSKKSSKGDAKSGKKAPRKAKGGGKGEEDWKARVAALKSANSGKKREGKSRGRSMFRSR